MKKTLLLLTLLCSFIMLPAQNEPQCGFVQTAESEEYFNNLMPQLKRYEQEFYQIRTQRRSSTAISSVPIKAHIIRDDSGNGGLTEAELNNAIAIMNSYYANAYLEFFLCDGINFIDSSTYYDFETDEQTAMTDTYNVNNVINIYFANSVVSSSSGGGLCGYAYFPGGPEVILMDNSCATNGSTLSHEMGHFFALSHTHGGINGTLTDELVDGSNCDSAGDFICDTPADPQLSFSNVSFSCSYTGSTTDSNGDTFAPNPLNIMSYSRKACRTEFSQGQYARIYSVYQASRAVMACPSFNVDIAANYTQDCSTSVDVAFTDNSVGATSWQWDVDGDDIIDYTIQNPTHTYTSSGDYDVTLTISNGSSSLTKVYQEFVGVGANEINTTQINLELTTDNYPGEIAWTLKNSAGTTLYSSPGYSTAGETVTENFIVATNDCYTFEITDGFGDGICCGQGLGSYRLSTLEGATIKTGGDYGTGETVFMSNALLGVDDYFVNNPISVYPNPTKDILNIKLSNTSDLPDAYTVYNVLGQVITSKIIQQDDDLSIDAQNLSEGIYYVKISKGNNSSTVSFIKN
ncbi:T9SS type A sorting domain-containing protein [uncultured Psychroserpens sp.]|uniref:T9SS type A sorting domain-containing protein n=1 Tax=uncultured Psychroserpens sp. TaxID=255436 RepID=UPI002610137C|nr:T9SS type A sorting domain-containing protein [uncultured Psychroserpens sp.]